MREHTFELPSDPRLNVKIPAGVIEIEARPGTEAFVRLSPIDDDDATREAIERAHVELHGNELAVEVRRLDMAASPYDVSAYGLEAVRIETPEGKSEYAARQREFSARGEALRRRLLEACDVIREAAGVHA